MVDGTDSTQGESNRWRLLASVSDGQVRLLVGLLMGLAIHGLLENADWLAERTWIGYPGWLLAISWPTLFLLSYSREHGWRALFLVSGFCGVLMVFALYRGWQHPAFDGFGWYYFAPRYFGFVSEAFVQSMVVACFIALVHLQPTVWGRDRDYNTMLALSWRNFLIVTLSGALTLGVWLVLLLWGRLFELVGIGFLTELFEEGWFVYPVLGLAFALGVHSFGTATSVIDRVTKILIRLFWLLLPALALATTCFVFTLPFNWWVPVGSFDLARAEPLAVTLGCLFSLNAVYQTGQRIPYPPLMHRALSVALVLYPVLAAFAACRVAFRIADYGWSPNRCWALLIIALTGLFSLGYAYAACRRRDDWPSMLPSINRPMSWVVLASLVLAGSPLLDFKAISAWSQFSRVESGEMLAEDVNVDYVRLELGRPGRVRLEALLESLDENEPEAALVLRNRLARVDPIGWTQRQQVEIVIRPERFEVPAELAAAIDGQRALRRRRPDLLFRVDLGGDEALEVVAVWVGLDEIDSRCWALRNAEWVSCGWWTERTDRSREELLHALGTMDFAAAVPDMPYMELQVGELRLLDRTQ